MVTRVYHLNKYLELYNILNTLESKILRNIYENILEEYHINRRLTYKMYIIRYDYFYYLESLYIPHIMYLREMLISRKVDTSKIEDKYKGDIKNVLT